MSLNAQFTTVHVINNAEDNVIFSRVKLVGNFLGKYLLTPPPSPINFVHGSHNVIRAMEG